ncbi:fatty acid synthase [Trichonephila inaurata madagascariensis]|uniref:Fatty acid synthase n=1 Tax=Trichonephila inaurata madagascariensis TaxID=2747483 RepID=A0A8X7CS84_9ARAC|nr:fatty acid synthase [Trichonephila inaurata madagascariensis]
MISWLREFLKSKEYALNLQTQGHDAQDATSKIRHFPLPVVDLPSAIYEMSPCEQIMVNPKPRSSGWISSSYVESEWNNPTAKSADACYFAHNLVSPILLHEALLHIPKDAVVLKISPYHLPQNVIACETECLFEKDIDPTLSILSCIGR